LQLDHDAKKIAIECLLRKGKPFLFQALQLINLIVKTQVETPVHFFSNINNERQ
jgi:hypothetical protein